MTSKLRSFALMIGALYFQFGLGYALVSSSLLCADDTQERIIISDVDDTIKMVGIKASNQIGSVVNNLVLSEQVPFTGMPGLFGALAEHPNTRIFYVTNAFGFLAPFHGGVLNHYPDGERIYKTENIDAEEFKLKAIGQIIAANPNAEVILLGDNGQKDPAVFRQLIEDAKLGINIKGAFVHRLYERDNSKFQGPKMADFLTGAGMAARFREMGWISDAQYQDVLETVKEGMASTDVTLRKLTLPSWAELNGADLKDLIGLKSETQPNATLDAIIAAAEKQKTEVKSADNGQGEFLLKCLGLLGNLKDALSRPY